MHVIYIIKGRLKRVGRKGSAENITGPKKTGPKTKVGRKVTYPTRDATLTVIHTEYCPHKKVSTKVIFGVTTVR